MWPYVLASLKRNLFKPKLLLFQLVYIIFARDKLRLGNQSKSHCVRTCIVLA